MGSQDSHCLKKQSRGLPTYLIWFTDYIPTKLTGLEFSSSAFFQIGMHLKIMFLLLAENPGETSTDKVSVFCYMEAEHEQLSSINRSIWAASSLSFNLSFMDLPSCTHFAVHAHAYVASFWPNKSARGKAFCFCPLHLGFREVSFCYTVVCRSRRHKNIGEFMYTMSEVKADKGKTNTVSLLLWLSVTTC